MERKLKLSASHRAQERFRLKTAFVKRKFDEEQKKKTREVVPLVYVFRELMDLPIGFLNEYLANRRYRDKLLFPKIQFKKYPDRDAFNIDMNIFTSLAIGFPVGYLHKPIPLSLAERIIDDVDTFLATKVIENKHKIFRHISALFRKLEED